MQLQYPINTEGLLSSGKNVSLHWVEQHEYDQVTNLRNNHMVRKWFVDDLPFEIEKNRIWLSEKIDKPKDSLLSIRFKSDGLFLGTIGWTDWDLNEKTAIFGRLTLDTRKMRRLVKYVSLYYSGFAFDAGATLRDFAFTKMNLTKIQTFYIADNSIAKRLNLKLGQLHVGQKQIIKPNGTKLKIVLMEMDRNRWLKIKNGE